MAKKQAKKASEMEMEEVLVTEEYLASHPELEAEGVSVGDTIEVPVAPKKTSEKLDMDGEVAILKGNEFVRVYPEGSEEAVASFLGKNEGFVAVSADSIARITVSWRETIKSKDADTGRIVDTGRLETKSVVFTSANGADWMQQARALANEAPRRSCVIG